MTESVCKLLTRRRMPLWFLAGATLFLLGLTLFWRSGTETGAIPSTGSSSGYQIEDGVVAWRPMTTGEQFAAIIFTLGKAGSSEAVIGRALSLADAASFHTIAFQYGLDRSYVWFRGDMIDGADPASFDVLSFDFSRDNTHIWNGSALVLPLLPGQPNDIDIISRQMFSVDGKTYLAGVPAILLPERPADPPTHYCRDWFMMNDTIWLGAQKVLPVDGEVRMLDCDGGISTIYEDGASREDIDRNTGLIVLVNGAVQQLSRSGDTTLVATMPEPVTETLLIKSGFLNGDLVLARGASGTVYAVGLQSGTPVQNLGRFDALPDSDSIESRRAFWLGDSYFTLNESFEATGPVTDHGPAEQFGSMALADGMLFYGTQVVARPSDMPLRLIDNDTLLIGAACYNFGSYVSDVADPTAEGPKISAVCQAMRPPDDVLYDGLRISFQPALSQLGSSDTNPGMVSYALGEVSIGNETDQTQNLPADFFQGIELRINGMPISPPDGAWDEQGALIEPGQSHRWTLQADTDDDPQYWGWTLSMRHNAARAQVFDGASFYIGRGQFLR